MEHLATYLKANAIKQRDFAAMIGTSEATVSRLVSGNMRPGLSLALAISRVTRGAVAAESWDAAPSATINE